MFAQTDCNNNLVYQKGDIIFSLRKSHFCRPNKRQYMKNIANKLGMHDGTFYIHSYIKY